MNKQNKNLPTPPRGGAFQRADGRKPAQLRPVEIITGVAPSSKGSVLIRMGKTQVMCAVSVEESVPRWMREQKVPGGWLTAEYSMLPYATERRTQREATSGKVGGRTQEIQRLIGRALRAVTDLPKLGFRTFWIDCDVLQADGGTRTAAVTGAFAALKLAVDRCLQEGLFKENPICEPVAAVSVGVVEGKTLLDLCYVEDSAAEVDMNIIMTESGKFIELQGTAERDPFSEDQLAEMLNLARRGIRQLLKAQKQCTST
ncbi:MAG: ribonuclease PH [Lentisphaerota bacterium]